MKGKASLKILRALLDCTQKRFSLSFAVVFFVVSYSVLILLLVILTEDGS